MPSSTSIPVAPVEFVERMFYPATENANINADISTFVTLTSNQPASYMEGAPSSPSLGNTGGLGAGFTILNQLHKGRQCARWATTRINLTSGGSWIGNAWYPGYGPAANHNPGAFYNDASVVGVVDFNFALDVAANLFGDDRHGMVFFAHGAQTITNSLPLNASGGGFGAFFNDDGAGVNVLEYLSWDVGGAILERIRVGAAVIPDITDWNTIRFIIVAAASGREATLTVQVNGVDIVTREFGSAELNRPDDDAGGTSNRFSWSIIHRDLTGSNTASFFQMMATFGRFLPSGAEMQGQ